ncbi:hypothetical protein F3529_15955 [Vibrio parahaemolyticus]|nr:hypothetical protein [Vibrio parahaemolyticus]
MTCATGSLIANAAVLLKVAAIATLRVFSSIFVLLYNVFLKCRYHVTIPRDITSCSFHNKEHPHINLIEL